MDPAQALADLTEISSQIEAAVLFDENAEIVASTLPEEQRARALVRAAADLLAGAGRFRSDAVEVTQLEVATHDGSVFVVRDGPHCIAATTTPDPTVGLVFYDLKSCLRAAAAEEAKPEAAASGPAPPTKRRRKKEPGAET